MKIKKIEFENFRNFKDHGEIHCSTDGRVTIIYGKNGDGKTTLHQLFQWIFYGRVHFNKTTTNRLYNLKYESEVPFGSTFEVMGCIDFEHAGVEYSMRRVYTYKKNLDYSEKIAESVTLNKMDADYNWKRVDKPQETIELLLPSGLSDYFFFDGESMIADLRVKGKDSADKLRKALYSMFDLDVLESAIAHIGRTDLKTTVLGKLYLSKGTISSGSAISALKTNIENAQNKITKHEQQKLEYQQKKADRQDLIRSVSEQIGNSKSKADYERQRKALKTQRDIFLKNASSAQGQYGDAIFGMFPQLLISKAVADAKARIHFKVEENHLPEGITKQLINYLLADGTNTCVCGNPICTEERNHIRAYLGMLPPYSYASMYNSFTKAAENWGRHYDLQKIEQYIMTVLENEDQARECDLKIHELDEAEKNSPDIEDLIVARQKAELEIREIDEMIVKLENEINKTKIYLNKQMKEFDKATTENAAGQLASAKIDIMEQVAAYFRDKLSRESLEFSKRLEDNIQVLIDDMLTSRRTVAVTPEFAVRVTDSFNDESKSEGQFAVVSFAYIGGILRMLRSEESRASKEYPLVLDGPFSKLDPDQRQNVVNTIPSFAPQVIIFSKDDLQGIFSSEAIGSVWTIQSNEEKNIARVEEGYLWK